MMYEISQNDSYKEDLLKAINAQSKNSALIKNAKNIKKLDFEKEVIL